MRARVRRHSNSQQQPAKLSHPNAKGERKGKRKGKKIEDERDRKEKTKDKGIESKIEVGRDVIGDRTCGRPLRPREREIGFD